MGMFALSTWSFWLKEGPHARPEPPPQSHCQEAMASALSHDCGADSSSTEGAISGGKKRMQTKVQGHLAPVTLGLVLAA